MCNFDKYYSVACEVRRNRVHEIIKGGGDVHAKQACSVKEIHVKKDVL